jgi:hypothetical protein
VEEKANRKKKQGGKSIKDRIAKLNLKVREDDPLITDTNKKKK